jgi:hypothetical protein
MYEKILETKDPEVLMRKDSLEKSAKQYLENSLNVAKKSKGYKEQFIQLCYFRDTRLRNNRSHT